MELKRLSQEKEELTKRLDIVASNIALLHKIADNGKADEELPSLSGATMEAMEALKRFTRAELAARIKHVYPEMEFNEGSVMKPVKKAMDEGHVSLAQRNQGSKKQAVYQWVDK